MPYDPELVRPMREELRRIGFEELTTSGEVDRFMDRAGGTALLVVNSVCGCAAGMARPGVRLALQGDVRPDRLGTVFAGQDTEATAKARSYFSQMPPSSPSMALFKDGQLVHFIPRHLIEGNDAEDVAGQLTEAFRKYCATQSA